MLVQPGGLLSPTIRRRGLKSRLLFHWRARDLSLNALTGQVGTFTRASAGGAVADRDGRLYVPVHSQPRFESVDTNGDGIGDEVGMLLEEASTNLVTQSDNFAAWGTGGSPPAPVGGQLDPLGGTGAYLLEDNDGGVSQNHVIAVTFAGDGTKSFAINLRKGTAAVTNLRLYDNTAAVVRGSVNVDWSTSPPTVTVAEATAAVVLKVRRRAFGFYRIEAQVPNIVAANTNSFYVRAAGLTSSATGTVVAFRAQVENAAYPSSDIATSGTTVTRAVDALTYPLNHGPLTDATDDFSLYVRFARPNHAEAVGTTGVFPALLGFGNGSQTLRLFHSSGARTFVVNVRDGAGVNLSVSPAIPAGGVLEVLAQYKDLTTAPAVAYDVGAGSSVFVTGGLSPLTSFGPSTILLGAANGAQKLGAPLFEAKIANTLLSLDQMREAL